LKKFTTENTAGTERKKRDYYFARFVILRYSEGSSRLRRKLDPSEYLRMTNLDY